jgi:ATP-dependent Clp endopeptidase proteolytic subunit ClpP
MNNWFEFKAFSDTNKIYIYDDIGKDGVTAKALRAELEKFRGDIAVHIDSAGGSVVQGVAIYNALKAYNGKKTVYIDSLAASMASVIAMAGDTILMPENGLMMIHNPWGISTGDATEHRKTADVLDKMKDAMVDAYHYKSSIDKETIISIMNEETWLNGQEALDMGMIDGITEQRGQELIQNKMSVISSMRDVELLAAKAELSNQSNVRHSAEQIINARKPKPTNNIFKAQNHTPSNYIGIK